MSTKPPTNNVSDITLNDSSFYSLHLQLYQSLRQLIYTGQWADGSLIPSEPKLARHLGISRSTVRLALQRAELEGLIRREAGKGTFVSFSDNSKFRSSFVAFVLNQMVDEWSAMLLKGAESEMREHGYRLIFCRTPPHQNTMQTLHELQKDHVAGVLLWSDFTTSEQRAYRDELSLLEIPVVLVDRKIEGVEFDCVASENYAGARQIMQHLIDLGHEDIVFLSHQRSSVSAVADRLRGYRDAMEEAGLQPYDVWYVGNPDEESTAEDILYTTGLNQRTEIIEIMRMYQQSARKPTAIFALNDILAVVALSAAELMNLHVPNDLSIAGFDDLPLTAYLRVPLTTVTQDIFEIGRQAAQLLLNRLSGEEMPVQVIEIPTRLHVRESTAAPPEQR